MQSRTEELPSLSEHGKLLPNIGKESNTKYRDTGGSMSVFSDLLSEYITMKDVGVYPLSQFCGLDRSFMYKIINGKRNPSGEDVVRKMAQFMQLTPREKTDFMDAFYITQMGEEVYYQGANQSEN